MNKNKLQTHLEEDLQTLSEILITSGPLPPRHVRAVCPSIVRKWLIEGNLNVLAKELSVKFELPAYDTTLIFNRLAEVPEVNFYMAGGIYLGGTQVRSIYNSYLPFDGSPPIPVYSDISLLSPGKYLKSKRIFFEGDSFSTEQIISFFANKHGGVHFDEKREKDWQNKLEVAANYMTFGNPNNEKKARVVESETNGPCLVIVPSERGNTWNCLEIEILSAAQSLLNVHCNGERLIVTK